MTPEAGSVDGGGARGACIRKRYGSYRAGRLFRLGAGGPLRGAPLFRPSLGRRERHRENSGPHAWPPACGESSARRYIQTFNSTKVGHEKLAAFYNHLPLMIDELQLSRGAKGKPDFDVYALAEGVGRTRGTRTGGVERTATWANCILTTGESPITTLQSGAGAVNRVIDIECSPSQKVIEDGPGLSAVVKRNYGFAGREFVGRLYRDDGEGTERAQELYKQYFRLLSENDTTEKQAMAASAILAADALATEWIFRDSRALSVEDLSRFLASKAAVSAGARGYEYMCQWGGGERQSLRDEGQRDR